MLVSLRYPTVWEVLFTVLILLAIRLLLTLWKYVHRRVKYNKLIPGKKYSWYDPFGIVREFMSHELVKNGHSVNAAFFPILSEHAKLYQKHGIFTMWISYMPLVVFVKAEAVEVLFKNEDRMAQPFFYSYLESLFGKGLITSSGDKWKSRRKLMSPCFHFDVLKDFVPTFSEQAQLLVKCLKQHNKGEFMIISFLVTRCVLEILLKTIFGVNIGVQESKDIQYLQSSKRIRQLTSERMVNVFYWSNFLFGLTNKGKEMNMYLNDMREFTRTIIQEKKKDFLSRGGSPTKGNRKALMDFLIESHMVTQSLGEEDIREEVDTFASAGLGTTATSICWSLYMIGLHKDIQLTIQEELFAVFGNDAEAPVNAEDLKDLTYLDCVVKESKRIYPTSPGIVKTAGEQLDISGSTVPKGAACLVLTYLIHRDEENFPNPEIFDPDRFLPENCAKRHPCAYLPFSLGPRSCIGGKFSEMEEKVILSTILRHFNVESEDQRDKVPSFEISLRPAVPIKIKLTPRR